MCSVHCFGICRRLRHPGQHARKGPISQFSIDATDGTDGLTKFAHGTAHTIQEYTAGVGFCVDTQVMYLIVFVLASFVLPHHNTSPTDSFNFKNLERVPVSFCFPSCS